VISTIGRIGANIIIWIVLLVLVVLPALTGSGGSVLAVLLALLLLPVLASREARVEIGRQPAMWMFLIAFAAIMACYAITAVNPGNLLYGTALLALPLAPLVLGAMPHWQTERPALVLAVLGVVGTLICALVAANSAFLTHTERAVGFLMGPNVLARIALNLAFLGVGGLFLTRSPLRYVLYLGPLAAGLVLILTGTRGAMLALPFMVLVLGGFLITDRNERRHLLVLVGLGVLGGALVLFNSARFESLFAVIGEVLSGQSSSDGATSERLTMLVGAWGTFLHSPWVGFGWANFKPAAALAMDMTPYGTEPGGLFQFHNDFANFAVAAGVVGVLALVAMLAAPVVGALAAPRDPFFRARLYCCLQLSISTLIFGLTDFTLGYDLPTTLYAFLTAMVLGTFRESPEQKG
jgi:O-antigen ligase